jgi:ribosome-associated toxin RatA of RatAB toxin-antitoxin module
MNLNRYTFRSVWQLRAPADKVFEVLADLQSYPLWWPEVRRVIRLDDSAAKLTVRSLLPYDLEFTSTQSRRDRFAGILEAAMSGDLAGFSRWTITPTGTDRCTAIFEEEVTAHKALLRRLALFARPAFKGNHRLMMHHGQAGLQTYLYGYAMALRESPDSP